jgi:hypothetical protein
MLATNIIILSMKTLFTLVTWFNGYSLYAYCVQLIFNLHTFFIKFSVLHIFTQVIQLGFWFYFFSYSLDNTYLLLSLPLAMWSGTWQVSGSVANVAHIAHFRADAMVIFSAISL